MVSRSKLYDSFWNRTAKDNFVNPKPKVELTWSELRAKAKELKVDGYTKMKRPELEEALSDY